MRLYSDLIKDKTVVINVMFTTCTGACPVMSGTLAKIQDHLGDRVGKDVNLISISVDPVNDTPGQAQGVRGAASTPGPAGTSSPAPRRTSRLPCASSASGWTCRELTRTCS